MQGLNAVEAGIPYYNISGFSSIGDNYVSPIWQPFNNFVIEDTLTKVWGKHSLRLGGSHPGQPHAITPRHFRPRFDQFLTAVHDSLGRRTWKPVQRVC